MNLLDAIPGERIAYELERSKSIVEESLKAFVFSNF
jgi:hypothetical protein